MDRRFLDNYYKMEREHWWFRVRESIILDVFSTLVYQGKPLAILNVGAATGRSSEMLDTFGTVRSIEYDEPSFRFCRDTLKMNIEQGSITGLPYPDNAFDCVCAFDVVEHVEDHELAIKELFRVCKPGGKIFITVPAFMSLWSSHDEVNHHYRRYTKQELIDLFSKQGGTRIRSTYFNFLLFAPIFLVRLIQRLFVKKKQEELKPDNEMFNSGLINRFLGSIFSMERIWLKRNGFPVGVSFMLLWEK